MTWKPKSAPTKRELQRSRAARGKRSQPKHIAALTSTAVLESLRQRTRFSAGGLESFTECPVKWLVDRLLNPKALEPDGVALVRGSYAHAVLEATLKRLKEQTGSARVTHDLQPLYSASSSNRDRIPRSSPNTSSWGSA